IPAVVGESDPQTDAVFERKVLYTNLPEAEYMGNRAAIMSLLTFADKVEPSLWDRADVILPSMDLQGVYQRKNLRTVLAAVDVLRRIGVSGWGTGCSLDDDTVVKAIMDTARRMDFHGRWEKLSDNPWIICDIGHNEHGLKYNFAQLESMLSEGRCTELIIIYGSVADKDVDAVMHLMPRQARYIFTNASSRRAMEASEVMEKYLRHCASAGIDSPDAVAAPDVASAVRMALELNGRMLEEKPGSRPLIYIGGSTYIVSEAVAFLEKGD
ncbi:MAG: glutamate ligase domain-containing protein, partial [Candidatus Cryptobacteroides sp.]